MWRLALRSCEKYKINLSVCCRSFSQWVEVLGSIILGRCSINIYSFSTNLTPQTPESQTMGMLCWWTTSLSLFFFFYNVCDLLSFFCKSLNLCIYQINTNGLNRGFREFNYWWTRMNMQICTRWKKNYFFLSLCPFCVISTNVPALSITTVQLPHVL